MSRTLEYVVIERIYMSAKQTKICLICKQSEQKLSQHDTCKNNIESYHHLITRPLKGQMEGPKYILLVGNVLTYFDMTKRINCTFSIYIYIFINFHYINRTISKYLNFLYNQVFLILFTQRSYSYEINLIHAFIVLYNII